MILLKRFEQEENIHRWYSVNIQPTLFEPAAVICSWGRWESSWLQTRILPANSTEEARELAEKIVTRKIKRGYQRFLD